MFLSATWVGYGYLITYNVLSLDSATLVRRSAKKGFTISASPDNPIRIAGSRALSRACKKIGMIAFQRPKRIFLPCRKILQRKRL